MTYSHATLRVGAVGDLAASMSLLVKAVPEEGVSVELLASHVHALAGVKTLQAAQKLGHLRPVWNGPSLRQTLETLETLDLQLSDQSLISRGLSWFLAAQKVGPSVSSPVRHSCGAYVLFSAVFPACISKPRLRVTLTTNARAVGHRALRAAAREPAGRHIQRPRGDRQPAQTARQAAGGGAAGDYGRVQ